MKKLSKLFLSLAMVFSLLMNLENTHAQTYAGVCGLHAGWKLDSETGILTISGTGSMFDYNSSSYAAPWEEYATSIKKVVINDGITEIGEHDFAYCENLTSVEIPETVTEIGSGAFYCCYSLSNIEIPYGIKAIHGNTFYYCESLSYIEIPSSVISIGTSAFSWCSSLTDLELPSSITEIDDYAFSNCSSLVSIEIPYGVQAIEPKVFNGCSSLKSVKLPDSIIGICDGAFWYCTSLTDINIPSSVEYLYNNAFTKCPSLTSITVPASVTHISGTPFSSQITIKCYKGSYIEQYAIDHNLSYDNSLSHTDHHYQLASDSATCTEAGIKTYKCPTCGDSYIEDSPAKGHTIPANVTAKTTAATCTKAGSVTETYTCPVCKKKVTNKTTIPALGHNLTNITTVEATYSKSGYTSGYCTNCKKTIKVTIPKLVSISLSKCSVTVTQVEANKLNVEVIDPNGNIVDPECYTVSYPATLTAGKAATVKITGVTAKGYSSSKSIKFKVIM